MCSSLTCTTGKWCKHEQTNGTPVIKTQISVLTYKVLVTLIESLNG